MNDLKMLPMTFKMILSNIAYISSTLSKKTE